MSKHVFAIENLVYEYSILDIKKFIGELDDVKTVDVDFKSKTVTVNGGDGDEIERKLMMNSFHVEKLEIDEPVKKRTLFKKNDPKKEKPPEQTVKTPVKESPENKSEDKPNKTEASPAGEEAQNKNKSPEKPAKKGGLFKKFLGKK